MKKDRTYIAQRDDEEILKVIPVDPDRWDAYSNARGSVYPCVDCPDLRACCVLPSPAIMLLGCCCITASQMPWNNCFKNYENPYPEGARGKEALVLTDVGIRGWAEKKNKEGVWEYEPVGIAWDNIRGPITAEFSIQTGAQNPGFVAYLPRAARCAFVPYLACPDGGCGPPVLWPANANAINETDLEYNTLMDCGLLCPCWEYTICQGKAPGLESYYRMELSSASFYTTERESGFCASDVVISARGLAEDPKALVDMIMERAAPNQKTLVRSEQVSY